MDTRRSTPVRHNTIPPEACSTDLRRRLLRESPFFADLTGGDIDRVNARFNDVGYEPGQAIIREGDPATRLGIVAAGVVKLFNYGDSGTLVLIDVLLIRVGIGLALLALWPAVRIGEGVVGEALRLQRFASST